MPSCKNPTMELHVNEDVCHTKTRTTLLGGFRHWILNQACCFINAHMCTWPFSFHWRNKRSATLPLILVCSGQCWIFSNNFTFAGSEATNSAPLIHAANVCIHNVEYCLFSKIWLEPNPFWIICPRGSSRSGPENTDKSCTFSSYGAERFPYYWLLIIYLQSLGVSVGKWSKSFQSMAQNRAMTSLLGPWSADFGLSLLVRLKLEIRGTFLGVQKPALAWQRFIKNQFCIRASLLLCANWALCSVAISVTGRRDRLSVWTSFTEHDKTAWGARCNVFA